MNKSPVQQIQHALKGSPLWWDKLSPHTPRTLGNLFTHVVMLFAVLCFLVYEDNVAVELLLLSFPRQLMAVLMSAGCRLLAPV